MATLTPAGQRLLDAASELFYTRGLHAVGVDLIAETAGTTKKTLYDRFGSKDALIALYLEQRAERWQSFVLDYLEQHAPEAGVDRVLAVLDALEAWLEENRRGCGFANANAELADPAHPAVPVIRAEKRWVTGLYVELVQSAGIEPAGEVGRGIALLHQGAIVARAAGGDPDAIDTARTAARSLLSTPRGQNAPP